MKKHKSNPVEKLIDMYGNQTALAQQFGIAQQNISKWRKNGVVPVKQVIRAEKISKGLLTKHDLNPFFYPLEN